MAWDVRYCSLAGGGAHDGSSAVNAWTLAEAIAGANAGDQVNIIAGTYTPGASITFATAGTTTAPVWWRGYNTNIGDCDPGGAFYADPTKYPKIDMETAYICSLKGAYNLYSNIYITTARIAAGAIIASTDSSICIFRCKFENTGANANSNAFHASSASGLMLVQCLFVAPHTATRAVLCTNAYIATFLGCTISGGIRGIEIPTGTSSGVVIIGCIFYGNDYGIHNASTATAAAINIYLFNTFYNSHSDAIYFVNLPSAAACKIVGGNVFSDVGGYAINQASGGNCATLLRMNNLIDNTVTSGFETGFGDFPAFGTVNDGANEPFTSVNPASADFLKLVSGSVGKAAGFPFGVFEGLATQSYVDIGALQRVEPAAGGGLMVNPGLSGGLR